MSIQIIKRKKSRNKINRQNKENKLRKNYISHEKCKLYLKESE